jgi:hypothetical protein
MTSAGSSALSSSQESLPQSPGKEDQGSPGSFRKKNMKRKRLARLVSQDGLVDLPQDQVITCIEQRSTSPPRSVSEFDRASSKDVPPLPSPLEDRSMLKTHIAALRLEAELHPMRLILTRLMSHQTHNRRGVFNIPVNAEALGLLDYHRIIAKPMDLGTVKRRLHSVAYQSRQQVADDIRLVFTNSMRYNPPVHPIHKAASGLLNYFEQSITELNISESSETTQMAIEPSKPDPKTMDTMLSTVDDEVSKPFSSDRAIGETDMHMDFQAMASFQESNTVESAPAAAKPLAPGPAVLPKSRLPPFLPHACGTCKGRTCQMCQQGCLFHEPALMVCQGANCGGARLRKGAEYFVSADGNRHYCQRCYTSLTPVLPGTSENDPCRYKQDLLKRKNDEEIAEQWVSCSKCTAGVHSICAMHNGFAHDDSHFVCPECQDEPTKSIDSIPIDAPATPTDKSYTFMSGSDVPVSIASLGISASNTMSAESLPECAVSSFIQAKVGRRMEMIPNADKTVRVRVVSDSSRHFAVPEVVRRHFRMAANSDGVVEPPSQVRYRQKAITLFQNIDGLDVCIFCMYVQEYDGDDEYDSDAVGQEVKSSHQKRVYIAYIDSVEHFRPRECRTEVYQEILVSYLATARARGYETAHIWACPPSRGNSFVFWNHPSSQRTPNRERLINWYHDAISRAIGCGVVTDVKSLFESEFEASVSDAEESRNTDSNGPKRGRMICPPLLEGDFWIEEAVRVHGASLARNIKVRAPTEVCVWNVTPLSSSELDPCPALQIAALVRDRVMTHPASVHFRRPVNAAALKLKNYHKIVTKPMDLGTIHAQCVIGEYDKLRQVVEDVELMVSNAKRFNPVGHFVHAKADEVLALFYQELTSLVKIWDFSTGAKAESDSWETYADMNMSLDAMMDVWCPSNSKPTSVFIEDDRSSDGSRSLNSSVISMPGSPMSSVAASKETEAESEENKAPLAPSLDKPQRRKGRGRGRRNSGTGQTRVPPKKLDLLSDGPDAVMQSMVGDDHWLLDKRAPAPNGQGQKSGGKKRRGSCASLTGSVSFGEEPAAKRIRQSWVGEEVSEAVRRLRTSFFTCSLVPKSSMSGAEQEKLQMFDAYAEEFDHSKNFLVNMSSPISDARHALLEFSQYRHFEFDTLRRAKYSTAMLLYHLKNSDAPGVIPFCSSCNEAIEDVRWHKVKKTAERRRITKFMKPVAPEPAFQKEELCACCHSDHSEKDEFIPIPVSLKQL